RERWSKADSPKPQARRPQARKRQPHRAAVSQHRPISRPQRHRYRARDRAPPLIPARKIPPRRESTKISNQTTLKEAGACLPRPGFCPCSACWGWQVEELDSGSGNSGNSDYALAHALKSRMKSVGQIGAAGGSAARLRALSFRGGRGRSSFCGLLVIDYVLKFFAGLKI